jgi:hypothetical protein
MLTKRPRSRYHMYGRHSGLSQNYGSSEERQIDIDEHMQAAAELSCEFNELPYYDHGLSGFYGDNLEGDLGRIKDDIARGAIRRGDVLAVESHSRLGRLKPGEAILQYLGFLRDGIRLRIKGNVRSWRSINGEQGMSALMTDFIEIYGAHEFSVQLSHTLRKTNRMKREKLWAGQKEGGMKARKAGWIVGNRCPAWLEPLEQPDAEGFMYRIMDSVAKVIRMIFQWADEGDGTTVIAGRLNQMKIEPLGNHHRTRPEKKLNSWSPSSVRDVLRNIAVIGQYQPCTFELPKEEDGEPIPGAKRRKIKQGDPVNYYPPLFPSDGGLFSRVQRALTDRNRPKGRNGHGFGNLFKGLGVCEICGGHLTVWSRSANSPSLAGMKHLRCENYRRKTIFPEGHKLAGSRCTNKHGARYSLAEAMLWQMCDVRVVPILAELIPATRNDDIVNRRLSRIEATIAENHAAITRLIRVIANPDTSPVVTAQVERHMARFGDETMRLIRDRDRLAQQQDAAGTETYGELANRVRAAKAKLDDTANLKVREETRKRLNAILQGRFKMSLNTNAVLTMVIEGFGANILGLSFSPERFIAVRVFDAVGKEIDAIADNELMDWPIPKAA